MRDQTGTRRPIWLLAIVSLALAALACDPPPVTGINCIKEQGDGSILAFEEGGTYISRDGGLSWQPNEIIDYFDYCGYTYPSDDPWTFADPSDPAVVYRFAPNVSVERSENGGATWRREIDLSGTEARTLYYVRFRNDGFEYRAGPSYALTHSRTGNLVVAMSYEGVLVRTPQGKWNWVGVGKYQRADMRNLMISIPLIWAELLMGLAVALMTISTVNLLSQKKNLRVAILGVVVTFVLGLSFGALIIGIAAALNTAYTSTESAVLWMLWLIIFCFPFIVGFIIARKTHQEETSLFVWAVAGWTYLIPSGLVAYLDPREGIGTIGVLILTIPIAIVGLVISTFVVYKLRQASPHRLILTLIFGICGFLVIAGVYFLWAIGGIAFYTSATLWAWGLGLLNLFVGSRVLKHLPSPTLPPDRPMEGIEFLEPSP